MACNFDQIYDRKAYNCIKYMRNPYDHPDYIPFGIADMDFATPDFMVEAMKARLEHPIFGYFKTPKAYYDSIQNWQETEFGHKVAPEEIVYQTSVLGALSSAVQTLTEPGETIMVQAPGYFNFVNVIEGLNRKIVTTRLYWNGSQYEMNFEELEETLEKEQVKVFLLCSPHNPTGRVWTRKELETISAACERHNVNIIADEIWADIVLEGYHIPFISISEWAENHTIGLYAPTKTFNIAGIGIAYSIVKNPKLREKFQKVCDSNHYNGPNLLAMEALIAAYSQGREWKNELCTYIKDNTRLVTQFFAKHYPKVKIAEPQGTYLLWLDFSDMDITSDILLEKLGQAGLYFNDGRTCIAYGDKCLRMNAALPRPVLEKALKRLGETL